MKKMRYSLLTAIAAFMIMAVSCINDTITTSPSATLTFSRDTVNFDTVFTDLGTPTARLVVRNPNKKGVVISSIRMKSPDSPFTFNVDGQSGTQFSDIEIMGRDSIYVFIECFIPESEGNDIHLREDDLEFITNGVTQDVHIEAYGQNVTRLRGVTLEEDMRITAFRPVVIFDSLKIGSSATLWIDPGAKVLFHDGAELIVEGRIDARGEPGRMIDMRGDRLDNVLTDVGYDILAGQWKGISIRQNSFNNHLEYVDMRSTATGLTVDSCAVLDIPKLTIINSWLHNSQGSVLTSRYAKVDAYGSCFSEAGGSVIDLRGGRHEFLQCTFANNYLFSAITGPIISLSHCLPGEENDLGEGPLMKANFRNSIIYGLASDINLPELVASDVYFEYVSFKAEGTDDENFISCLWNTDPLFLTDRQAYYFNYRLQPDSPVIEAGNPEFVTETVRFDMDGVDRLGHGNPSLGAYQFVPNPEDEPVPDSPDAAQ